MVAILAVVGMALATLPNATPATARKVKDGSGGRAIAHHADAKVVRSAAKNAPDAKLFRTGLESNEPTLGVTPKGDIFVSAFQSNTRIEVVKSTNGGAKWQVVSPRLAGVRNAQTLSLDPYVYVDKHSTDRDSTRVFTIDLTVACSYLSFTDDGGKSWLTNPLACGRPVNDHQTLFSAPPVHSPTVGYPNIVYYCWNDVGSSSCGKSLDGGITFHPTGSPAFTGVSPEHGRDVCGGLHGHGFGGYDGTIYVPRGYCGQPHLAISKDEGKTWTRVKVANNGMSHHESGIVADKKGNLYYTWVADDRLPYLAISRDGGKSWTKPMMIAPPGVNETNLPTIDVGATGKIAIAYMGSTNSPFKPGKDFDDGECTAIGDCLAPPAYGKTTWNGYVTMTADALARKPLFYSGPINHPKDPLVRTNCGPGRCHAVLDFIDVSIGPDGTPWVALVDACTLACAAGGPGYSNSGEDGVVGRMVGGPRLR